MTQLSIGTYGDACWAASGALRKSRVATSNRIGERIEPGNVGSPGRSRNAQPTWCRSVILTRPCLHSSAGQALVPLPSPVSPEGGGGEGGAGGWADPGRGGLGPAHTAQPGGGGR